ncbi:MAG: ATP-dependent DNA helicase RecG [Patescibacteria group bacterium]|nr:ATP-dependent DNA helicase RecG [Patescibacteria group bacterium]
MLSLSTKIESLNKVGPAYLKKLHKLNIKTIQDLFFHFPHRYEDFSKRTSISELKEGEKATIQAEIVEIKNTRLFHRKMSLTEALVKDNTGMIKVTWFNQPYLIETLKKGKIANFSGKLSFYKKTLCLSNPVYELAKKETTHTGRLVPIYPETEGISSRYLRFLIKPLLYLTEQLDDFLPTQVKNKFNLMDLAQAIEQIHFPKNFLLEKKARKRLAFNELFLIQLASLQQKQKIFKEKAIKLLFDKKLIKPFVDNLPFKLTDDQKIAAWEIFQDIVKNKPMNRLLNGDVGSGKTIVAIMVALAVAKQKYQVAIMTPTEILAKQHFQTFKDMLKNQKIKIALLTSSSVKKAELKKEITQGKIDIIIGTHAIIQKDVSFKNLAMAIVDEQHRFGVAQRAALQKKICQIDDGLKTIPHLLSMTATPIPRTLALTIYGDLDISLIKELPKGRQKIITKIVSPKNRDKTYNFIKEQIKEKRQVFVICPLIEESNKLTEIKSVTQEYEKLSKNVFPEFKLAMLHGKLKPKEKEKIMDEFKKAKTDILISTSVVEVGVDIPNATVMIIEGADRFGLAQLHQFRGRIGREKVQSHCFLFTDSNAQKTNMRLKAILTAKDGFELAEKDLKIRGAGDFIGTRQWGLPDLVMASLNDLELIKKSREVAEMILKNNLINQTMKLKLKDLNKDIHLE